MKNPVSLIRCHWASHAATLIPGSTDFRPFERQKNPDGPPCWLPEVPIHGYFDCIGGELIALFRTPDDDATLWFQIGGRQIAVTEATSSAFTPAFAESEPLLENASVERRFQVFDGNTLLVDHSYRLGERSAPQLRIFRCFVLLGEMTRAIIAFRGEIPNDRLH